MWDVLLMIKGHDDIHNESVHFLTVATNENIQRVNPRNEYLNSQYAI